MEGRYNFDYSNYINSFEILIYWPSQKKTIEDES